MIRVTVEMDAKLVAAVLKLGQVQAVESVVGTNLIDPPYPYFLEFGTSRMSARPSARPAFEETKARAQSTAARIIADGIAHGRYDTALLEAAGNAGGLVIANRWKSLAPVRTGTYRRSIHVETSRVG